MREAIGRVPGEMLNLRADLHVELATVIAAAGHPTPARSALRTATGLHRRKGNLVAARRVQTRRTELEHQAT